MADGSGPPPAAFPALAITDLMVSGLAGPRLARELMQNFPGASRTEVYQAIGLAVAVFEQYIADAEIEIQSLRAATVAQ